MGALVSGTLDAQAKRQQEFMLESQKLQMERQIHMQNLMRERQMAMQIAMGRQQFLWFSAFSTLVFTGAGASTKNRLYLSPFLPLGFLMGYQADLYFFGGIQKCREAAEKMLEDEPTLLLMPNGAPTVSEIETRRLNVEHDEQLSPNQLFL